MSEFNNRISAQRDILLLINSAEWSEELYGLSSGAIERWITANNIKKQSALIQLIQEAASKLFFLSNKSQEQITDEYRMLSKEVQDLTEKIKREVMEIYNWGQSKIK
ncbi:hypothetical protein JX580_00970 [Thiomicrospira microaerophila]|uniref:hypothetical protein n=1 Tax=Thiomicrospira microaerophila TaxID=406020 RepID=UPI0020109B69|nr:hypothetical protein [Thiomicrospira microaerophila]UQB42518.1 hypothetical protein JX580_00970 [Thiomicrospira microaerophila]